MDIILYRLILVGILLLIGSFVMRRIARAKWARYEHLGLLGWVCVSVDVPLWYAVLTWGTRWVGVGMAISAGFILLWSRTG